ncbi:MAG: type II secretion system protein, partial [Patescibacteria group bacterium]
MKTKAGFTLIELMVVIAIIGLLDSVVLASLNSARNKGADASIKGNLDTVRKQAALFYDSNGENYGFWHGSRECTDYLGMNANAMFRKDATIKSAVVAAKGLSALPTDANAAKCVTSPTFDGGGDPVSNFATSWAIAVMLKTSTDLSPKSWCVDSSG